MTIPGHARVGSSVILSYSTVSFSFVTPVTICNLPIGVCLFHEALSSMRVGPVCFAPIYTPRTHISTFFSYSGSGSQEDIRARECLCSPRPYQLGKSWAVPPGSAGPASGGSRSTPPLPLPLNLAVGDLIQISLRALRTHYGGRGGSCLG